MLLQSEHVSTQVLGLKSFWTNFHDIMEDMENQTAHTPSQLL